MNTPDIKLTQSRALPSKREVDTLAHWVMLLPIEGWERLDDALPYGEVLKRRYERQPAERRKQRCLAVDLPNPRASHVAFACVPAEIGAFELLTLARQLVAPHVALEASALGVCVCGFEEAAAERMTEALLTAALAASTEMPRFTAKKTMPARLERIEIYGCEATHGFERSYAEAEGNGLARQLTGLPANELTPGHYRRWVTALAKGEGWHLEFLDLTALARRKAGAFLAVAQGSPEPDAGIVHLKYGPPRAASINKTTGSSGLALCGKGICFDTGGVNLKPANFMLGMHKDMQGSAVALGTLLALTRLKVPFPIECWLALATNHIGPSAYKPNDVVTAMDGTTIEIVNTDAEGRMVLCDTLTLASRAKPALIIDFATLTGACKRALGNSYSGVFTNRPEYYATLIEAGRESGERVWPFPLDPDYDEALESTVADIKQCAEDAPADHILAARFLQRFVKDGIPWIHIDLSSGTHKGGLAHIPSDITGFGVRLALHLLLDKGILGQAAQVPKPRSVRP